DHAIGSQFNVGITTVTYTATDASENTATASFTVTVTSATGIDQLSKTSINVYPNPVVDLLSISTGNTCDSGLYSIISVLGTIEVSGTISNGKAIVNVSRLSRGTYIVRVQIGNIGINHSIIKR
ncbi:MAG TPA: hypothetical protein DIW31_11115, partial [Bacteroidales bacterium]|nr:hypothetical protein [Bacteroidales bacterium]